MIKLPKTLLPYSLLIVCLCFASFAQAQSTAKERNEVVKFGIGLRMVATSDLLSGAASETLDRGVLFSYEPRLSRGIDAIIRFKLRNRFSFQTGITSIRRSYNFGMSTDSLQFSGSLIQTGFQMPFTGIVEVPIAEKSKVGVEGGFIAEMIPGEVGSGPQEDYYAFIYVQSRLKGSFRASAFINFDLEGGGKIETGFTYVRMATRLGSFYMDYDPGAEVISNRRDLQGHFFTFNVAFFFP
ncbi:MAG: hypothetical protein JXQ87_10915 [Bacteroidia bacterium]